MNFIMYIVWQNMARALQREFGTDNPFRAAAIRGVQQSVALKGVLGASAVAGASTAVAGPLAVFGITWMVSFFDIMSHTHDFATAQHHGLLSLDQISDLKL